MEEEHCLICDVKNAPIHHVSDNFSNLSSLFHTFGKPVKNVRVASSTLSRDSGTLDHQLPVILLLRKVLRLPKPFVESILKNTGDNPSTWNLGLCSVCHRIFEEASFVWERLRKLHQEFDEISQILRTKITQSTKDYQKVCEKVENQNDTVTVAPAPPKRRRVGRPKRKRGAVQHARALAQNISLNLNSNDFTVSQNIRIKFASFKSNLLVANVDADNIVAKTNCGRKPTRLLGKSPVGSSQYLKIAKFENPILRPTRRSMRTMPESGAESTDNYGNERDNETGNTDKEERPGRPVSSEIYGNNVMEERHSFCINKSFVETGIAEELTNPSTKDPLLIDPLSMDDFDTDNNDNISVNSYNPDAECSNSKSGSGVEEHEAEEDAEPSASEAEDGADDIDFNPSPKKSTPRRKKRKAYQRPLVKNGPFGVGRHKYKCPKCHARFEDVSSCDAHIMQEHMDYGRSIDKVFRCELCTDACYTKESRLQLHMRMRHSGATDATLDESNEGSCAKELQYDVLPFGESTAHVKQEVDDDFNKSANAHDSAIPSTLSLLGESIFINRTMKEAPPNTFSVPVLQQTGKTNYLVLPNAFEAFFPKEVVDLFKRGMEDKRCASCSKSYPTEIQLRAHVLRTHEGEEFSYECPICFQKFERIGKLAIGHMQRAHMFGAHICDTCGKTFRDSILLDAHIQRSHLGIARPYKCIKCNTRHESRCSLNKHLKRNHNLQVANLSVKQERRTNPFSHLKRVPGPPRKRRKNLEKKFVCTKCAEKDQIEKFATEAELDVHVKRKHLGISRPYPCTICKIKFSRPWILEKHMKIHTVRNDVGVEGYAPEPEVFVCIPCNKQFKAKHFLKIHLEGVRHQNHRPYVCEICSQTFRSQRSLENHQVQKHHDDSTLNPFMCTFCNQILSSERHLDNHIRIRHTKNAKFSCPFCPQQFQHESAKDRHVNVRHTKTTKFVCSQCPREFLNEQYLGFHMARVHSDEKPYECSFCQKRFSDKPTYNRHVEAHSNILHTCPHCPKGGFKTRHALRVHVRTRHEEVLLEPTQPEPEVNAGNFPAKDASTDSSSSLAQVAQSNHNDEVVATVDQVKFAELVNNWKNVFQA